VILLILAAALTGAPEMSHAAPARATGETFTSKTMRRDLGEKGLIIIESLELNEADLSDVVRLLARIAGINIITGDIKGSISVYLENVTVQSALEAILSSQGYGFIYDGNIVRVVDASRLGEDRVETVTESFPLNYLPALEVATNLKKVFTGGQGGASTSHIEANIEANTVIAVDTPRRMEDIRKLIQILDQRNEQVEIEGRFVEISYTQDQQYGLDWKYFQDPANTLDVNLAPGALNASNVAGQFKFAVITGQNNLTGFLQALETDNDIRVLANPKILALENKEALIELINEIPFVEANVSQGVITESVQFQKTGITLKVTPQIAEEAGGTFVRMKVELEQRIAGPNVVLQNSTAFPIDARHAKSELIVPDDSTVIIGGLRSNDMKYTYDKIPVLGNIPFFGLPFRKRIKKDDQTELLLFVTPRVIYDHPPLDCKEQELHDKIEKVADSLETQSEWRENAEAPFETFEKGVLYSGVNSKPEKYEKVRRAKDAIEGVKPFKVSKNKGHRRFRISGEGKKIYEEEVTEPKENEEMVPVGEEPAEGTGESKGEVRDFKKIEGHVKPGTGSSGAGWYNPDRGSADQGSEPAALPSTEKQEETPATEKEDGNGNEMGEPPGWLRRGARQASDAGPGLAPAEYEEASAMPLEEPVPEAASNDSIEQAYQQAKEAAVHTALPPEEPPPASKESPATVTKQAKAKKAKESKASSKPAPPHPSKQTPAPKVDEAKAAPVVEKRKAAPTEEAPKVAEEPPVSQSIVGGTGSAAQEMTQPAAPEPVAPLEPPLVSETMKDPDPAPQPSTTGDPWMISANTTPAPAPDLEPPKDSAPAVTKDRTEEQARLLLEAERAAKKRNASKAKAKATAAPTAAPPKVPEIQVSNELPPAPPSQKASGKPPKQEPIVGAPISKASPPEPPKADNFIPIAAAPAPEQRPLPTAIKEIPVVDLRAAVEANASPKLTQFLDPATQTALAAAEQEGTGVSLFATLTPPAARERQNQNPLSEGGTTAFAAGSFLANSPNPMPIIFGPDAQGAGTQLDSKETLDKTSVIVYNSDESKKSDSPVQPVKAGRIWWRRLVGSE
jgi:type IV pilus assembly protein PilQ